MNRYKTILGALLASCVLAACDEGNIIEEQTADVASGRTVSITGKVVGAETWPRQYSLVIAGFAEGNTAVVQQNVTVDADGSVSKELTFKDPTIQTVELCVTDRLRQRIQTFASVSLTDSNADTIRVDAGQMNMDMYQSIQDLVFNPTCANCHGGRETAAAGLYLIQDQSYASLVNHPAKLPENGVRVVPGDVSASLLHRVVQNDEPPANLSFHANMVKEMHLRSLIDNWIAAGAK